MGSYGYIKRLLENYAFDPALTGRHMIFLAGPRQAGKTRLARHWLAAKNCEKLYYNWDDIATRQAFTKDSRFFESAARSAGIKDPWISFDEIHKRNHWRDILKGAYDVFQDDFRFLITGSARLDLFRKSGDSLVGRYNLFHLMPFTLREVTGAPFSESFIAEGKIEHLVKKFSDIITEPQGPEIREAWDNILVFGPFPEPFLNQSERFCRKWHMDYFSLLVREDLRDISRVVELDKIEKMVMLLPERIASPLSMPGLARDIEAAHTSVKSWLEQLKKLYLIFDVRPWSKKIHRGLKKEKKWYFLDWYFAPEGPARLENAVATCLFRYCRAMSDMGYGNFSLNYVRTLDKREIDFLVVRDNQPIIAVEVKASDATLSRQLANRATWFADAPTIGIQLVEKQGILKKYPDNTWLMSVDTLLSLFV